MSAGTTGPAGITVPLGTAVTLGGESGPRVEITVRALPILLYMYPEGVTLEQVERARAVQRQRVYWITIHNLGPVPYLGEPKNLARVVDRQGIWHASDIRLTSIFDPRPDIGNLAPGATSMEKGVVFVVGREANGQDRVRFALRPGVAGETADWQI